MKRRQIVPVSGESSESGSKAANGAANGAATLARTSSDTLTLNSTCFDVRAPSDNVVSEWMSGPKILNLPQKEALEKYREPQLELKSYLNLVASIGTMEVQRSFAVGVLQLMCRSNSALKVLISLDNLLNVKDATVLQCFWRAAYRAQVSRVPIYI
jgi:hypothetical protein